MLYVTRETAAFGGVSLALRRRAAFGVPSVPTWEIESDTKFGVPPAPQMVLTLQQGHEDSEYVLSF